MCCICLPLVLIVIIILTLINDILEQSSVRIASPGEIKREYELEKQKQELELKKKHDEEAKASEALIQKLKEEEEYQQCVEEEKIKFDEVVAKQIAQKLNDSNPGPSSLHTSKHKKHGPLDKFLRYDFIANSQQGALPMGTKVFTTRILCQDGKQSIHNQSKLVHRRVNPHIRRITAETEVCHSSDSIESECRYFKPIDHKNVPQSKAVAVIKIPAKLGNGIRTFVM